MTLLTLYIDLTFFATNHQNLRHLQWRQSILIAMNLLHNDDAFVYRTAALDEPTTDRRSTFYKRFDFSTRSLGHMTKTSS